MVYRSDLFGLPIYEIGVVLLVIAAVLTLWSMVAYLQAAWPELRQTTTSLDRLGSGSENLRLTKVRFREPKRV